MWTKIKNDIKDKYVLEIGGPSEMFMNGPFEIYSLFKNIDGLNLKTNNIWQKEFSNNYLKGKQFFGDCTNFLDINNINNKYDIILSTHIVEHIANPLKSIILWKKILKENGKVLCFIPNKEYFWDDIRDYTTIEHIINDYNNDIKEDDKTHLEENLKTSLYKNNNNYVNMANNNFEYRVLHHHTFNTKIVQDMFEFAGYKTINCFVSELDKLHIIYFGEK